MSPRQARRERREAERKAHKAELRRAKAQAEANVPTEPASAVRETVPVVPVASVPQSSLSPTRRDEIAAEIAAEIAQLRARINRSNARHSTGPKTEQGKLASSRNSLKHGLASGEILLEGEDPAAFEDLQASLVRSYQPATEMETLLVKEMAQSYWLTQRAVRLQNTCFSEDLTVDDKRLALFLRYQTAHERAFYKALNALTRLQKERRADAPRGFVSQNNRLLRQNAATPGFVSHDASVAEAESAPASPAGARAA